jgi:drug/metabolite transporter (DMT)-like permease
MSLHLTLLVLLAAAMHATWNTLIKRSNDRLAELAIVNLFSAVAAATALPWVGIPDSASWGYIFGSIVIHSGYYYLLLQAYHFGDLSHVYPLARGVSPLVVTLLSAVFAGEILSTGQLAGVLVISLSVASLTLQGSWWRHQQLKPVLFALGTGFMIGGYTLVDGTGARVSGNAPAYIAWLFTLDCLPLLAVAMLRRHGKIGSTLSAQWRTGAIGGVLALSAYGLVIWALSLGAMAPIAALRETSVVMAAVIGTTVLREPFGMRRVLAAISVATGVIILRLAS